MMSVLALLTPPETIEYLALIPGVIVSLVAFIVVLADTLHRPGTSRDYLAYVSAVGLALAVGSCWALWDDSLLRPVFHGMIYLDRFSLFFAGLCSASALLAVLLVPAYSRRVGMDRGEIYMLILFSTAGMIFMANAADMLTIFLGLEVMSIPIYCVAGYLRRDANSAEAAMKYFILGAFSTGLLLYGIALLYGLTGTTNLEVMGVVLGQLLADPAAAEASKWTIMVAVLLVLSGFGFKIAAVPFHLWTPDVYTGSPTPAVGFMSTAVKAGAFAGMIRVFLIAFWPPALVGGFYSWLGQGLYGYGWVDIFLFLSAASFVLGNLVAIVQDNVKRMLAYSSIAHAGYILIGFVAASSRPDFFLHLDTVLFYLLTYTFGTLGAFGVLAYLGRRGERVETYDDLAGLGFKYPLVGLVMGLFMLSSAGLPPTAGFIGKLYVFRAAVSVGLETGEFTFIGVTILAVIMSVAGIYYYLRVLVAMFMQTPQREVGADTHNGGRFALVVCALATLYFGIFPSLGVEWAREAVVDFRGAPSAVQVVQRQGAEELERLRLEGLAGEAGAGAAAPAEVEVQVP